MVSKIFLDMDGVLCDFRGQCEKFQCINGTKVDWDIVHNGGTDFWETIEWLTEGKEFFKWLVKLCKQQNIDLFTLTAVKSTDGKIGRMNWMRKNLGLDKHHLIIVNNGKEKTYYADSESLLIDDYKKNCDMFIEAGGQAVKYDTPRKARDDILGILGA